MNTNDLYLEYARVIRMCEGTELADTPWVCVKVFGLKFTNHPKFCDAPEKYEFAVAALEGKPVFVGDRIYAKRPNVGMEDGGIIIVDNDGIRIEFGSETSFHIQIFSNAPIDQYFTWTPPTPKRTFTLNGIELPCPNKNGIGHEVNVEDTFFAFDTLDDAVIVSESFLTILTEARDK